jgi:hypothetical protein
MLRWSCASSLQPEVLGDVGVLVFVDEDVAEPPLVLGEDVRMRLEDRQDMQEKVAEIDGVQRPQPLLVLDVEFHPGVVEGRALGDRDLAGRERAVLPAVDQPGELPGGPALFVDVRRHDQLLEEPDLVVGVEDGEAGLQPHEFGMPAQELDADRVEGAEPGHALHLLAEKARHALLHLARGLVGEGDGEDLVRTGGAGVEEMRDAGGERAGLARPCPREHQDGALEGEDRLPLGGVQVVEQGRAARGHGPPAERHRRLERVAVVEGTHRG